MVFRYFLSFLAASVLMLAFQNCNDDDIVPTVDPEPFITTWEITSAYPTLIIPTYPGYTYNYDIKWGDGNMEKGLTGDARHDYEAPGQYQVQIIGDFPGIFMLKGIVQVSGSRNKLLSIDQWGQGNWESMHGAFYGCNNSDFSILAEDIPDLTEVTDMSLMFAHSAIGATDLSGWDVSHVTNMREMFSWADTFNGNISSWDVSNVTDMAEMFRGARIFNHDLSSWNVGNVTDMTRMFHYATSFNSDLSNWDVSNVRTMTSMFVNASSFNSNIENWDISSCISLWYMFYNATSLDQNFGKWDIGNVQYMNGLFDGSGISIDNYEATLNGWAELASVPSNLTLGANDILFCDGSGRAKLIAERGWTILGDRKASDDRCN